MMDTKSLFFKLYCIFQIIDKTLHPQNFQSVCMSLSLYIYIYISSSSSLSSHTNSMDFLDFLFPSIPILHHFRQIFQNTFSIGPTLMHSCVVVHRRTSLMNLSLLFHQCPAYLVYLTWIVCEMRVKLPYSCCFSRICSKQHITFLCSSHLAFSP